jgi:gamma-glutamyltranspeptidase/glutathione hydrolase
LYSTTGIVTAQNSIAAEIGAQVLAEGGNAVDAAVAVGFSLAVALPRAGNIGGGGFMLVYDAESGATTAIDYREMAPPGATRDMFLDEATAIKRPACPVPWRAFTTRIKNSGGYRGSE